MSPVTKNHDYPFLYWPHRTHLSIGRRPCNCGRERATEAQYQSLLLHALLSNSGSRWQISTDTRVYTSLGGAENTTCTTKYTLSLPPHFTRYCGRQVNISSHYTIKCIEWTAYRLALSCAIHTVYCTKENVDCDTQLMFNTCECTKAWTSLFLQGSSHLPLHTTSLLLISQIKEIGRCSIAGVALVVWHTPDTG